jgi:hypothetical protein
MAAMILFNAFCVSGILFLVAFFVALCRDGKKSEHFQYVVKAEHDGYVVIPSIDRIVKKRAPQQVA